MPRRKKRWSWRVALGRAAGPAIGLGVAGAVGAGLATGGLGAPLGGAIAGGGAFLSSFLGTVFGHWADEPPSDEGTFGSALLFTTVVSGFLGLPCFLLAAPLAASIAMPHLQYALLGAAVGFFTSTAASLVDDWRARGDRDNMTTRDRSLE